MTVVWCSHWLSITGIFPQGYGIVFLPKDASGQPLDRYEFAIVNSLYPPQPEAPICRVVTRNLHYRNNLPNSSISVAYNLYFKPARQQLSVIPPQRLHEILSKLSSDFEPGRLRRLLPRYWHPDEFLQSLATRIYGTALSCSRIKPFATS